MDSKASRLEPGNNVKAEIMDTKSSQVGFRHATVARWGGRMRRNGRTGDKEGGEERGGGGGGGGGVVWVWSQLLLFHI